jgi:hypothetical protein
MMTTMDTMKIKTQITSPPAIVIPASMASEEPHDHLDYQPQQRDCQGQNQQDQE